jgi:hypothetical protein
MSLGPAASRIARIIGLLSLALALAGCSAIKLGYSNAPQLAYLWLDGYLDFDDAQDPRVRDELARLQAWHRANELPRIVQLLQRAERLAAGEFTAAQACAFEPAVRERLQALRERLEPALATQAVSLTPAQLDHLARKLEQKNRDWARDWVQPPPAELLDKRVKQAVGRAEMLYGSLDERQRALLRQELARSGYDSAVLLAERRRRQQDLQATLRRVAGASPEQARPQLAGVLDRIATSPDPGFRSMLDGMRQDSCRVAAQLHALATPEQRERAVRRLRAWQRDLSELAAAP